MISLKKIGTIVFLLLIDLTFYAQCAMCKATLESDLASGGTVGKGINNGILYLMIFPYLIVGVGGYFIYRHFKKNNTEDV
jgi:hypothetical protein